MPDSRRRIIVDGLEPGALVRFPLILRSIGSAFQPPRLVVALFVVLCLMVPGRIWDAVRGPRLAPGELLGAVDPDLASREAAVRKAILARWAPLAEVPRPVSPSDAASVDAAVQETIELLDASHRRWQELGTVAAPTGTTETQAEGNDATEVADPGPGGAVRPASPDEAGAASDVGAAARSEARYRTDRAALLAQRRLGEFAAVAGTVHESIRMVAAGLLSFDVAQAWRGTRRLFVDLPVGAWTHARPMAAVFTPLLLAVWALGGGALSRMAATFIGRGERATIISAVRFARRAWLSLLLAPVVPLLAAGVALVPAALIGLLLMVPGLDVVGGVLYGLALVAAVFAAILLIGLGAGAPLVAAVIAAERCDAIDAAQRPYAFLLRRPVHLVAYLSLSVVVAGLTYVVAAGIAGLALDLAAAGASIVGEPAALAGAAGPPLLGPAAPPAGLDAGIAGTVVGIWRTILLMLVAAAIVSAWASATTAAYLLLRQSVDGQDPEEIWEEGMVPGTFAHRATTPLGDHGIPPRRTGLRGRATGGEGEDHEGEIDPDAVAEQPGVPAAVEQAVREEAASESAETIEGEDLATVLAEDDADRPAASDLEAEVEAESERRGEETADAPDRDDRDAVRPREPGAGGP